MESPKTWRGRPFALDAAPPLTGRQVRLELLAPAHAGDLQRAGGAPEIWRYLLEAAGPFDAAAWVASALADRQAGLRVPYAVIDLPSGAAIGSTSLYFETRWPNLTFEVGSTWLGVERWGTGANAACKRLLLEHAFEGLGAERVEFLTDVRNVRSQRALERLGAQREGVLRAHALCADGHRRDSVCYAILRGEWPAVKARAAG